MVRRESERPEDPSALDDRSQEWANCPKPDSLSRNRTLRCGLKQGRALMETEIILHVRQFRELSRQNDIVAVFRSFRSFRNCPFSATLQRLMEPTPLQRRAMELVKAFPVRKQAVSRLILVESRSYLVSASGPSV